MLFCISRLAESSRHCLASVTEALASIQGRRHPSPAQARVLREVAGAIQLLPLLYACPIVVVATDIGLLLEKLLVLLETASSIAVGNTSVDNVDDIDGNDVIALPIRLLERMIDSHPEAEHVLGGEHGSSFSALLASLAKFAQAEDAPLGVAALQMLLALLHQLDVGADADGRALMQVQDDSENAFRDILQHASAGLDNGMPIPALSARVLLKLAQLRPACVAQFADYSVGEKCISTIQPQAVTSSSDGGTPLSQPVVFRLDGTPDSAPVMTLAALSLRHFDSLHHLCKEYELHWRIAASLRAIEKVCALCSLSILVAYLDLFVSC